MSRSFTIILLALVALTCGAAGQTYDYQKKGYKPPALSGATTCVKNSLTGNTPALCPGAVPLTDEGKPGSTTCVTGVNDVDYEGVISLMYPAPSAVPWCTSDEDCGSTPGIICATSGPTGSGNMCFPLAPSACPFPESDKVNSTNVPTARKLIGL